MLGPNRAAAQAQLRVRMRRLERAVMVQRANWRERRWALLAAVFVDEQEQIERAARAEREAARAAERLQESYRAAVALAKQAAADMAAHVARSWPVLGLHTADLEADTRFVNAGAQVAEKWRQRVMAAEQRICQYCLDNDRVYLCHQPHRLESLYGAMVINPCDCTTPVHLRCIEAFFRTQGVGQRTHCPVCAGAYFRSPIGKIVDRTTKGATRSPLRLGCRAFLGVVWDVFRWFFAPTGEYRPKS